MPARASQEMCVELEEKWEFKTNNCRELDRSSLCRWSVLGSSTSSSTALNGRLPKICQLQCVQLHVVRGTLYTHTSHEYALYRTTT